MLLAQAILDYAVVSGAIAAFQSFVYNANIWFDEYRGVLLPVAGVVVGLWVVRRLFGGR